MRQLPYHLNVQAISRSARRGRSSRSVVAAAAYRSGQKLEVAPAVQKMIKRMQNDAERPLVLPPRARNLHDYRNKPGVIHSRIMVPTRMKTGGKTGRTRQTKEDDWFYDREKLWNTVEAAEKRKDAQLARELNLFLPHVTDREQNIEMVEEFIRSNFTSKGMIADYAIHEPSERNDDRNVHVHIMLTMRRIKGDGFEEKKEREWNGRDKVLAWRYNWAEVVNKRINPMGFFVDYRSNKDRGLEMEAQVYEGPSVTNSEWQENRRRKAMEHNAKVRKVNKEKFLNLVTEKKAIFEKVDILDAALHAGYTPNELEKVRKEKLASGELIQLRDKQGRFTGKFTTKAVREQEEAQAELSKEMAARQGYETKAGEKERILQSRIDDGKPPTEDQRAVVDYVTSDGGFKIVKGPAGTGKSFTLKMIKEIYEESGYRIIGMSHTNKVVNDMRSDGFKEAYTLSRFLLDQKKRECKIIPPDEKTVIMVDEAAMMSLKQDEALFNIVQKSGTKLVYVGDENQFPSIDRGNAFGRYAEEIGFESLETIMRQKNGWDKEVSRKLGTGLDPKKGLQDAKKAKEKAIYEALTTIRQQSPETLIGCKDDKAAMNALVGEWISDSHRMEQEGRHESRFIIAQTNNQVNALNDIVQRAEIEAGRVDEDTLQQFETVRQEENPHTGELEVKAEHVVSVGIGSRIQFGRTDHDMGIANGLIGEVTKMQGSHLTVKLDEPYQDQTHITFDTNKYADFALGYAGTNYKAQGKTFDTCYVLDSNNWTSNAFYVAMSRARNPRKFFYSKKRHPNLGRMAAFVARTDDEAALSTEFKTVSRTRKVTVKSDLKKSKRMPKISDAFDQAREVDQHEISVGLDPPSNDNE